LEAQICVLGAGPAGAFLARLLADRGYRVSVYDVAPGPAAKPCDWGLPYTVDRVLKVPSDHVIAKIREYRVTVDWGYELGLRQKGTMGYIVDKPGLISWLLEGVDVHWGRAPRPGECRTPVYARGHAHYRGRRPSPSSSSRGAPGTRTRSRHTTSPTYPATAGPSHSAAATRS